MRWNARLRIDQDGTYGQTAPGGIRAHRYRFVGDRTILSPRPAGSALRLLLLWVIQDTNRTDKECGIPGRVVVVDLELDLFV